MAYSAEISRRNPTCFLLLIDQSGSMGDPFGSDPGIEKAQFVSDAVNKTIQNLVLTSAKSEGIRDYFWIGVIGYGETVGSALSGEIADRELVIISELANTPARLEERIRKESDGAGGIIEVETKFPVWLDPRASGGTPMGQAFSLAKSILERWIADHPDAFPPVVLHMTDGESTDGNPESIAESIRDFATSDGNVLLFNLHVSTFRSSAVTFLRDGGSLPDDPFASLLFDMSSPLPPHMLTAARAAGYDVSEGSRGFVFNAGIEHVVDFLRIGTQPANLR